MTDVDSSLILTKTLDPADFLMLDQELQQVDRFPIGHEQHAMRRWEYAMCLRAIRAWNVEQIGYDPTVLYALDVGGAGSTMRDILTSLGMIVFVVDPRSGYNLTLQELVDGDHEDPHVPKQAPVVVCISTLEHIPGNEYYHFLGCLCRAVAPGGLLFLTSDIQEKGTVDLRHFHWMRERIYDPEEWFNLGRYLIAQYPFELFGASDPVYHGDHVYDYSFVSMALRRGTGL